MSRKNWINYNRDNVEASSDGVVTIAEGILVYYLLLVKPFLVFLDGRFHY